VITLTKGKPGEGGCFRYAPWPTTYAVPQGSPLGAIPEIAVRSVGPNGEPSAWLAAITAHQRVLQWIDAAFTPSSNRG